MPAVRKPTAMLEASGAFTVNPERARKHEPDTGRGVGPCPDFAPEAVRQAWDSIVGDCAPGVFQSSDRVFLLMLATQVARLWREGDGFGIQRTTVLLSMFARAGMTPSDRSRVMVPPAPDDGKPKTGLASFRK
jgi:hypothetical protein